MNGNPGYNWQPQPMPPVQGGNPSQAPVGNTGVIYGTQQRCVWQPGATDARQVCDALKPGSLWRFSCFGPCTVTINYGTQANRSILTLQAPVVMTIPGQFTATATPVGNADLERECVVTLTQATAGARSIARRFVAAPAGSVNLDPGAVDFFALTASTLTISGAAVVVPALQIVPLVSGSTLDTGSGFQEFEA